MQLLFYLLLSLFRADAFPPGGAQPVLQPHPNVVVKLQPGQQATIYHGYNPRLPYHQPQDTDPRGPHIYPGNRRRIFSSNAYTNILPRNISEGGIESLLQYYGPCVIKDVELRYQPVSAELDSNNHITKLGYVVHKGVKDKETPKLRKELPMKHCYVILHFYKGTPYYKCHSVVLDHADHVHWFEYLKFKEAHPSWDFDQGSEIISMPSDKVIHNYGGWYKHAVKRHEKEIDRKAAESLLSDGKKHPKANVFNLIWALIHKDTKVVMYDPLDTHCCHFSRSVMELLISKQGDSLKKFAKFLAKGVFDKVTKSKDIKFPMDLVLNATRRVGVQTKAFKESKEIKAVEKLFVECTDLPHVAGQAHWEMVKMFLTDGHRSDYDNIYRLNVIKPHLKANKTTTKTTG